MVLLEVDFEEHYYKCISSVSGIAVTLQVSGFVTSSSPTAKKINKCEYLLQYDLECHVCIRICQNPSISPKDISVVKNIAWCIFPLYIVDRACNRPPNNVAFQSLWTWWLEQQATVLRHDGDKSIHFCLCNGPISSAAVVATPDVGIRKQGLGWGL